MTRIKEEAARRFWAKVDIRGPDECWPWTACFVGGYGQFRFEGKHVGAHRVAYRLVKGLIPADKIVRHTCDNQPCCNPGHLVLGTEQDNKNDMVERGRSMRGERHWNAKLTAENVIAIYYDGRLYREIAASYGTSFVVVSHIKRGIRWKHITNHLRGGA